MSRVIETKINWVVDFNHTLAYDPIKRSPWQRRESVSPHGLTKEGYNRVMNMPLHEMKPWELAWPVEPIASPPRDSIAYKILRPDFPAMGRSIAKFFKDGLDPNTHTEYDMSTPALIIMEEQFGLIQGKQFAWARIMNNLGLDQTEYKLAVDLMEQYYKRQHEAFRASPILEGLISDTKRAADDQDYISNFRLRNEEKEGMKIAHASGDSVTILTALISRSEPDLINYAKRNGFWNLIYHSRPPIFLRGGSELTKPKDGSEEGWVNIILYKLAIIALKIREAAAMNRLNESKGINVRYEVRGIDDDIQLATTASQLFNMKYYIPFRESDIDKDAMPELIPEVTRHFSNGDIVFDPEILEDGDFAFSPSRLRVVERPEGSTPPPLEFDSGLWKVYGVARNETRPFLSRLRGAS